MWARAWILTLALGAPAAAPAIVQDLPPDPATEQGEDPTSPEAVRRVLERAPRRQRRDGAWGVRITSRVVFDAAPDQPHELIVTAGFPARTRVELVSQGGRVERYQLGTAYFGRDVVAGDPAPAPGYALEGAMALETELDLALRRAVFLWPDGLEFVGAGRSRTSKVGKTGVLLAQVDAETGLPTRMTAFGPDGQAAASIRGVRWSDAGDRPWPRALEFWAGGGRVWREEVRSSDDGWVFADPWFLPPGLMGKAVGKPQDAALRMRATPGGIRRVEPLPAPIGVDGAAGALLARWGELDRELRAAGGGLGPRACLLLDGSGRAMALEFTMDRPAGPLPEGWEPRPGTVRWVHLLPGGEAAELAAARERMALLAAREQIHGPLRLGLEIELDGEGKAGLGARRLEADAVEVSPPEGDGVGGDR